MSKRTKKTKVKHTKDGAEIQFSEADGRKLAKHIQNGGSLMDMLTGKFDPDKKDEK